MPGADMTVVFAMAAPSHGGGPVWVQFLAFALILPILYFLFHGSRKLGWKVGNTVRQMKQRQKADDNMLGSGLSLGDTRLTDPNPPQYKLYSIVALDLATFIGTMVAGVLLLASNYRKLGDSDSSRSILILGLAASAAYFYILVYFDLDLPDAVLQFLPVGMIHAYATWKQGEALLLHEKRGGTFFPDGGPQGSPFWRFR